MGIESATFVSDLNSANPLGSDKGYTLDDHMRLIKAVLLATFPNANWAINLLPAEANLLDAFGFVTGGGTANAHTASPATAWTSYGTGQWLFFKAGATNTAAATMAVSGMAAKTIKMTNGNDVPANAIKTNGLYMLQYDGTNFMIHNPLAAATA